MTTSPTGTSGEGKPRGEPAGGVQAAIGVAGSLVALGAYLYLLGGFVLWLKFTAARLPADDAVGSLDSNRLLAVGMKAFIFELVVAAALYGVAVLTLKWVVGKAKQGEPARDEAKEAEETAREAETAAAEAENAEVRKEKSAQAATAEAEAKAANDRLKILAWKLALHGLTVWILVGALISRALDPSPWISVPVGFVAGCGWVFAILKILNWLDRRRTNRRKEAATPGVTEEHAKELKAAQAKEDRRRRWVKTGMTVLAVGLALLVLAAPAGVGVLVLLLFLHLSHMLKKLPNVRDPAKLIPAVLVITGGLSLVVACYLATTPVALDRVLLVMDGEKRLEGGYVGQSSEGVYVAACQPKPENPTESRSQTHVRIVPPDRIRRTVIGGKPYILDYETHPSVVDLALHLLSQDPLDELTSTVSVDVREDKPVCGLEGFFEFAGLKRKPLRGAVTERLEAFGAGSIRLLGDEIEPQEEEATGAGDRLALPIVLDPSAKLKHQCQRKFRTKIEVRLTLDDGGESELQPDSFWMTATPHSRKGRRTCRYPLVHEAEEVSTHRGPVAANAR
jgi:F0F1-type ATP synthase assembly protein I